MKRFLVFQSHSFRESVSDGPEAPIQVLSRHGRSFRYASHFLGRTEAQNAARLYAFCREVDDLADLSLDQVQADSRLRQIERGLSTGRSTDPIVADLLALAASTELDLTAATELVRGVRDDLGRVEIASIDELLRYCFRVAGTVGLMMGPLLGIRDRCAEPFAIDLGIAMQLTNIARDVMEDAAAGRRYLPGDWTEGLKPEQIVASTDTASISVQRAIARVLRLAERYYRSGEAGLVYLPEKPRLAITIAARLYREIGRELERRELAFWEGRAVVSPWRKLRITARILIQHHSHTRLGRRARKHDPSLHRSLTHLRATNAPHEFGSISA